MLKKKLGASGEGRHSLKTAARTVMAAQRFAESGGHGGRRDRDDDDDDDGASVMTSNMHRSEASVPFNALIHFLTFSTEPELSKPWQMKKPQVSTGTGFYIGNRRILTNSHVIRHSTSLRVERHGQPGNYPARVLCEGVMCDLAIVTVDNDDFFTGLPAVRLQTEVPELDDTVICLGYPLGATSITVTRGVVSNVHMKDLSLRGWNDENLLLTVQIDAAINPGNSGGPVFSYKTAAVVGVAFAGRVDVQGMGFIIPVPVIQLFLDTYERTKAPRFASLPMLGIATQDLINPSLRRMCFGGTMPPSRDGILITEVQKGGCAALAGVKAGDVLVRIDGVPISEKGDVPFRGHERLDWVYLVTKKPTGAKVTLDILRRPSSSSAALGMGRGNLEHVSIEATLVPTPCLLPSLLDVDYSPGWVIIGGLTFLRAGQPLLDQIMGRGATGGFTHVSSLMSLFEKDSSTAGVEEAVILQDVLAHDINVSYEEYRGLLLHSINGTQIRSLQHLAQFYASCQDTFLHVEFGGNGRKEKHSEAVVLELSLCQLTQTEILMQHKIPNWCSDDVIPGGSSAAHLAAGSGARSMLGDPMALLYALAGGAPVPLAPASREQQTSSHGGGMHHPPPPRPPVRAQAPAQPAPHPEPQPEHKAAVSATPPRTPAPTPHLAPKPAATPPHSPAPSAHPAPKPAATAPQAGARVPPPGLPPGRSPRAVPSEGAFSALRSYLSSDGK